MRKVENQHKITATPGTVHLVVLLPVWGENHSSKVVAAHRVPRSTSVAALLPSFVGATSRGHTP